MKWPVRHIIKAVLIGLTAATWCIAVELWLLPASAQSIPFPGPGTAHSTGGVYVGPGDINGAAFIWGGLRAYNAAYATGSNPSVDLVDQLGLNPITINILSNGNLDNASIAAWVTAHIVTTIKVAKLYDQTGGGRHWTQSTLLFMPNLVLNPSGLGSGKYAIFFNDSPALLTTLTLTIAQPYTLSLVAQQPSNPNTGVMFLDDSSGAQYIMGVNDWIPFIAATYSVTAADAAFHAAQSLFNNASSGTYLDGSLTSGSVGTTSGWAGHCILGNNSSGGGTSAANVYMTEFGIWAADKTANNSAMNSNQHTYWGF